MVTYEMLISDDLTDGCFAISLVDSPAIQTDYILLSKDDKVQIEIKLEKMVDKKRQVVCGPVLIPNLVIPRNDYNIVFSSDTIRKISENFLIDNYKDNVTLQHKVNVNKIYMVESWIVEDPKLDKSSKLGYDVPPGTWFASFKVNDENLWNEYIASGILKGFSIEGNFSKVEVKLEEETSIEVNDLPILDIMLSLDYNKSDLDSYYVWKLGDNENNCPACIKLAGKVKTLRNWSKIAIPKAPYGEEVVKGLGLYTQYPYGATNQKGGPAYGTYCEDNCHCKLVKIIQSPISR